MTDEPDNKAGKQVTEINIRNGMAQRIFGRDTEAIAARCLYRKLHLGDEEPFSDDAAPISSSN